MFCKNCGRQLPPDAHFCGNCGNRVREEGAEVPSSSGGNSPTSQLEPSSAAHTAKVIAATHAVRHYGLWAIEILLWLSLAGHLLVLFGKAFQGELLATPANNPAGLILLAALLGLVNAKRRGKQVWRYSLAAGAAGLLIQLIAAAIAGYFAAGNRQARLYGAINRFAPAVVIQGAGEDQLRARLQQLLVEALLRAPDSAVVKFDRDRHKLFDLSADPSGNRCADAAVGQAREPGENTLRRISTEAMLALFELATPLASAPRIPNADRAQKIVDAVLSRVDPGGELAAAEQLHATNPSRLCALYLAFLAAVHTLPESDAAEVIRYLGTR